MPRRPHRQPGQRLALLCAGLLSLAPAAAVLTGCSSDERDPKQPLNADEGAELLREVRDDPDRLQSLTPAERQYLMRTLKK